MRKLPRSEIAETFVQNLGTNVEHAIKRNYNDFGTPIRIHACEINHRRNTCLKILMEKFREKGHEFWAVFVDLEKAFDRVPRELIWISLRRSGVPEKWVEVVKDMYKEAKTTVRTPCGETGTFGVAVGVHQGSALNPLLFVTVMDVISEKIEGTAPWTLLFVDDLAIVAKSKRELEEKLEEWRKALEDAGLKISRSKTEAMRMGTESEEKVMMAGGGLPDAVLFKYLGSTITITADCEKDVESRIGKAWNKWKSLTGVMCDKKMPAWFRKSV